MKNLTIITSLVLFTSCCGLKMNQEISDKRERVNAFLNAQTRESDIPGIQYVVVDSNQIIYDYAGGLADIKNLLQTLSQKE